jgi:hypothetical protein
MTDTLAGMDARIAAWRGQIIWSRGMRDADLAPLMDLYGRAGLRPELSSWEQFEATFKNTDPSLVFTCRDIAVREFAWALPSEDALALIASLSPIVEVGAGSGFWADLLRQRGADLAAFDVKPFWVGGHHRFTRAYFPIARGGPERALRMYPDRTLLLVWPGYGEEWATDALRLHRGDNVVIVGEGPDGCTGADSLFAELDANFDLVRELPIPQWFGIHDYLAWYRRR